MRRVRSVVLVLLATALISSTTPVVGAPAAASAGTSPAAPDTSKGRVIVGYEHGKSLAALGSAKAKGARLEKRAKAGDFFVVQVPKGETSVGFARKLEGKPGVRYAEPDRIVHALLAPDDPGFHAQWGMTKIGAPAAWDVTRGDSSVKIAIVDTGVDLDHPDLIDRVDTINDYDFANNDFTADDDEDHGTHCAGVAAATADNGVGVAGVANLATILPVKVLDSLGEGPWSDVADGVTWAADHDADVISLSLGDTSYSTAMDEAVQYAVSKGCSVVAAAGNDGSSNVLYPARLANVIGVGATDSTDARADFSNHGPGVDVSAPGEAIYSTIRNSYGSMSGTSMAAPHVAGAIALVRSKNPTWSRAEADAQVLASALDLGTPGRDDDFGYGRLRLAEAVGTSTPPPVVEEDDDIPGIGIPASPVIGTLDQGSDNHDVYRIHLYAGQTLNVSLSSADPSTDFDLYLFPPAATSVGNVNWVARSSGITYPEAFTYTVSSTGWYYLDARAYDGTGPYTITYQLATPAVGDSDIPGVAASASPITGGLTDSNDKHDVFSLPLQVGQELSLSLTGSAATDFDANLFAPGSGSVLVDTPVATAVGSTYPDEFTYVAAQTGVHYIDLTTASGSGSYVASYTITTREVSDWADDVPGETGGTSPRKGSLHQSTDVADVFAFNLEAGERLVASLEGPVGSDFDLALYPSGTTSIDTTSPVASSLTADYPETVDYTAPVAGTYYLAARSASGSGDYTLDYHVVTDNGIPGLALGPSPVTNTLDQTVDRSDVFFFHADAGEWVYFGLTGPQSENFDLVVFTPGAPDLNMNNQHVFASSQSAASSERIMKQATTSGTYYVWVFAQQGSGAYTLRHGLPSDAPSLTVSAPSTVSYGGTASIAATMRSSGGAVVSGYPVTLEAKAYNSTTWVPLGTKTTNASGVATFSHKPTVKTYYQARVLGSEVYLDNPGSSSRTVTPKAYVRTPIAPTTMSTAKSYSVYGYLKPRHTSGTSPVRIYKERYSNGKWYAYGYVSAKASNYSSYSKYSVSMRLTKTGRWRLRAYHADTGHAASWSSGFDYVTVK